MNRATLNTKRQLLADLFRGKSDNLQIYQRQQKRQDSPLLWIVDTRTIDATIKAIDKQGNQTLMSEKEFEQLPQPRPIWQIVDYSGGRLIPGIDE